MRPYRNTSIHSVLCLYVYKLYSVYYTGCSILAYIDTAPTWIHTTWIWTYFCQVKKQTIILRYIRSNNFEFYEIYVFTQSLSFQHLICGLHSVLLALTCNIILEIVLVRAFLTDIPIKLSTPLRRTKVADKNIPSLLKFSSTLGCPKKNLFLNFVSVVELLVRTSSKSLRKKFQRYRPINDT